MIPLLENQQILMENVLKTYLTFDVALHQLGDFKLQQTKFFII